MNYDEVNEIPYGHLFESVYHPDFEVKNGYTEFFVKTGAQMCVYLEQEVYHEQESSDGTDYNWIVENCPGGLSMVGPETLIIDHGFVCDEIRDRLHKHNNTVII